MEISTRTLFFIIVIGILGFAIYRKSKTSKTANDTDSQSKDKNKDGFGGGGASGDTCTGQYCELQRLLRAKGYSYVPLNNQYDPETDRALTDWARKTGKGVVGSTTLSQWVALLKS